MAGEQAEPAERRKGESSVPVFPIVFMSIYPVYLFISSSGSRLPQETEGLDICLWCVFKVGRSCLTGTKGLRDLGEDRRLPL